MGALDVQAAVMEDATGPVQGAAIAALEVVAMAVQVAVAHLVQTAAQEDVPLPVVRFPVKVAALPAVVLPAAAGATENVHHLAAVPAPLAAMEGVRVDAKDAAITVVPAVQGSA